MPGRDGTGPPNGTGPGTGRRKGWCGGRVTDEDTYLRKKTKSDEKTDDKNTEKKESNE